IYCSEPWKLEIAFFCQHYGFFEMHLILRATCRVETLMKLKPEGGSSVSQEYGQHNTIFKKA
ncbi:hypothetical protein RYX36_010347, partial [Vicia faba]